MKESKDYESWSKIKKLINNTKSIRASFHEREIWFCAFGENIGFEQDGKGIQFLIPAIIIRKFNNEIFWGIPLTSTKKMSPYYYNFSFKNGIESSAILSQIRLVDAKRLSHCIGYVPKEDFIEIKKKLKALIP